MLYGDARVREPQIWDIQPVVGKTDRFRIRLTDGATCAAGAAIGPAGKAITDGEVGDRDLIELDSGSVSSVAGKLMVNGVDGVLRKQPPAHAEVQPPAPQGTFGSKPWASPKPADTTAETDVNCRTHLQAPHLLTCTLRCCGETMAQCIFR